MKKLKLLTMLLSMISLSTFADNFSLKALDTHNDFTPYMLIHGISHHSKHADKYNQENYGVGFGIQSNKNHDTFFPFAQVGSYKDSYNHDAYYAMSGMRYIKKWDNVSVAVNGNMGYLNGSGFHSLVAMPSFTIQYKRVGIETLFVPTTITKAKQANVLGMWLKLDF